MTTKSYYARVVPDSHRWTDLNQLLYLLSVDEMYYTNKDVEPDGDDEHIVNLYEPLTFKYLITGLKNTLKDRTKLVLNEKVMNKRTTKEKGFSSIEEMIEFLNSRQEESVKLLKIWSLEKFKLLLHNTIYNGYNLKPERKMERHEIYRRIDTERDYQDLRWTPRREKNETPDNEKPPAEWLNYIRHHLNQADEEVYHLNDEAALAHIRKVAALAIRCLELYGCPERIIPADLLVKDA